MNFLPCRVGEGGRTLHLPGGVDVRVPPARVPECARHVGRALTFGLRPEHVLAGDVADDAHAAVGATVQLVEPLGSDTLGLVRLGDAQDAGEITGRFPPETGLVVGDRLAVSLVMTKFHLFDSQTGVAVRAADW
jgi:ABC-type sugar transport system ATPase subunit